MSDYLTRSQKYKKYPYDILTKPMIHYLQSRCLTMLAEVVKIFNRHGIKYMICGGTLLGAVTRQSFFDWDDDIDICVLEGDYDNIINCLLSELPEDMILQCKQTEPRYYHKWIKVRDKNSIVYPNEKNYKYNGVWIDIYCMTSATRKEVAYKIHTEHLAYLFRKYCFDSNDMFTFVEEVYERNLIPKILEAEKNITADGDNTEVYIIRSASNVVIPKELVTTTKKYTFEGMQLDSFENADEYLKIHYGNDYMTLPPPSRRRIGIEKVKILNEA